MSCALPKTGLRPSDSVPTFRPSRKDFVPITCVAWALQSPISTVKLHHKLKNIRIFP